MYRRAAVRAANTTAISPLTATAGSRTLEPTIAK
jgi:hypothetical protein